MSDTPNFDPVARPYRWLEYLSFGPYLERCRFHFLSELTPRRCALILGDGDGRFTARLLAANREIAVDAIDSSAAMLRLLAGRVERLGPSATARLKLRQMDALRFIPANPPYDLVATHFFLDCLTEAEIAALLARLTPHLTPEAIWVVSEFAIPAGQPAGFFSRIVIGALYRIFGILTGLEVRRLPDYAPLLRQRGFSLRDRKTWLGGLLVGELWLFARER